MQRTTKNEMPDLSHLAPIPKELLDHLVKGPMTAGDVEDVMRQLKKALIERALGAELA